MLKLLYHQAANNWNEALPLGNGFVGMMVYGGVEREHIQFNEESLWTGQPRDYSRKGAYQYLSEIRSLLFQGKQKAGEQLAQKYFMGDPLRHASYLPFGNLYLDFIGHSNYKNYHRSLDLNKAIHQIAYQTPRGNIQRTYFVSYPDRVFVAKLTTDAPKALDVLVSLASVHENQNIYASGNELGLEVRPDDSAVFGLAKVMVETDGEIIVNDYNQLQITSANYLILRLAAATNYINYEDVSGDPMLLVKDQLSKAQQKSYDQLKEAHLADYQNLFNRFEFSLGNQKKSETSTPQRHQQFLAEGNNLDFLALLVQYARYLIISASRRNTQAATLQGIWNDQLHAEWGSKYTLNINLQMVYWLSEISNLQETHQPLLDLVEELAIKGERTAQQNYNSRGWMVHHTTDIWRASAPANAANHGIWQGGPAWLCLHLWEHFQYNQDLSFLKNEAYPIIRSAALFYLDTLIKAPESSDLITAPSNSPEHGGLVLGPAMDRQLIRVLFKACTAAARILGIDLDFADLMEEKAFQVKADQIAENGLLQEWLEDRSRYDKKHRHLSHLWALFPGSEIHSGANSAIFEAAKKALWERGDSGTGWSLAWKINCFARLLKGEKAYSLIPHFLRLVTANDTNYKEGGTYPNLLNAHPPFQLDGNIGGARGILELLIQCHNGFIHILPALPKVLTEGYVKGIKAPGGFELEFAWRDSLLQKLIVHSLHGKKCHIRYKEWDFKKSTTKGDILKLNAKLQESI